MRVSLEYYSTFTDSIALQMWTMKKTSIQTMQWDLHTLNINETVHMSLMVGKTTILYILSSRGNLFTSIYSAFTHHVVLWFALFVCLFAFIRLLPTFVLWYLRYLPEFTLHLQDSVTEFSGVVYPSRLSYICNITRMHYTPVYIHFSRF